MLPLFLDQWLRYALFQIFRVFVAPKAALAGCTGCGKTLPKIQISPAHLWDTRIDCPHCGRWMSVLELEPSASIPAAPMAASFSTNGEPLPMPVGSRIEVVERAGTRMWRLPAKGGFNFLTVFALFWLAISLMALLFTLFGKSPGGTDVILFAGTFVIIGWVILFFGIKLSHTEHWLLLNDEALTHESRLLWRAQRRLFERDGLTDIALVVAYEENYQPVHSIQITGRCGKSRFGVTLTVEEKAWLLSDLRRALRWKDPTATSATTADEAPLPAETFQAGGLQVTSFRDRCEILLSPRTTAAPWLIVGGFVALALGFMLLTGPPLGQSFASPLGNALHLGFALIWYLPLGVAFASGVLALWTGLRLLRLRRQIIASADGLRLLWRRGSQHGEWHWDSAHIRGIEIRNTGRSSSNHSTFRIAVALPEFVGALGQARTRSELTPVVNALNAALRGHHPPTPKPDPH